MNASHIDADTLGALGQLTLSEAAALGQRLARPLVFTHGVFDVLDADHVDCLGAARRLGRALVVGLHTDDSVRRMQGGSGKGTGRPLHAQHERARVLAGLRAVTTVLLFDESTPVRLIEALRPDVYAKRGECRGTTLEDRALVAQWGGRTVIVPRSPGLSTTGVDERVLGAHGVPSHTRVISS